MEPDKGPPSMPLIELTPDSDIEAESMAQHLFKMLEPNGGYDFTTIHQGYKVTSRLSKKFNEALALISPDTILPYHLSLNVG